MAILQFLQHPLKNELAGQPRGLVLLGGAQQAVAFGLEELLHGQGLGVDGAPHPATALAPGQAFTAGHDVPAQCFALGLALNRKLYILLITHYFGAAWQMPWGCLAVIVVVVLAAVVLAVYNPVRRILMQPITATISEL